MDKILLLRAKDMLKNLTPIAGNCGRLCGASCCQGDEKTGMQILPGEEEISGLDEFGVVKNGIFVCNGSCPRERRPYACMIFPLFPLVVKTEIGETIKPIFDLRAENLCPLVQKKIQPGFYTAVRRSAKLLFRDENYREYFLRLSEEQREIAKFKIKLFR